MSYFYTFCACVCYTFRVLMASRCSKHQLAEGNEVMQTKMSAVTTLVKICTSIRTVCVWVDGYERSALGAYRRSVGEVVYFVQRQN